MLFSIADIDNAPETETPEPNEEGAAENEDAEEEDQSPSLPIRTAITISKVRKRVLRKARTHG